MYYSTHRADSLCFEYIWARPCYGPHRGLGEGALGDFTAQVTAPPTSDESASYLENLLPAPALCGAGRWIVQRSSASTKISRSARDGSAERLCNPLPYTAVDHLLLPPLELPIRQLLIFATQFC